ncbi:site-specific DNA-methyltransferase [Seonamhaeicola sp. ML3]|uniref:site-specific DNA-methyltransferase n=1 Tax=Seonamhaeicola sp. ML3 TaxID=2937786 RepID=UPI00200BF7D0|nr:site-specific DNA-methyltransferase [Seonamhaeicola sp. ML3]
MPTLNWIGKEKVINHHQDVPYKILEPQYTFSNGKEDKNTPSENKIIHGDNLEALKSLLPEYEGKIKCIYIDPPYNTGNEGWVYNDNVNHPKLKKWLGQVVGKESEDLSRHDKWLCMMYPRLKLLHKLLADDGAIFISIDDNEQANLKLLCDEIFGVNKYVGLIPWRKRTAKSDVPNGVSQDYESILLYSKGSDFKAYVKAKERKYYETPDLPNEPWRIHDLTKQTSAEERPNSYFTIIDPKTGKEYPAQKNRTWAISKDTFKGYYDNNRIVFPDDYEFLNISKPAFRYFKKDDMKKAGKSFGFQAMSTNLPKEVGMSQDGTKEMQEIFGEKAFNYPKPSTLIQYLLMASTEHSKDCYILDSFAGSGTTAHAVFNLNKQDGGNRKFILVEMEDYANTITAERVKRVIKGYGEGSKATEGTGGDFTYYVLGKPLFLENGFLNEAIGLSKILEYVWYTETKEPFSNPEENYLLGAKNDSAYYFYYQKDNLTTLDESFLRSIKTKASQYIIYADNCLLDQAIMDKYNIVFKKIPRDITRF